MIALAAGALMAAMLPGSASAVQDASKAACKKGGWQGLTQTDGTPFANQGQCASHAAQGDTPIAKNPYQAACESAGFAYSTRTSVSFNHHTCTLSGTTEVEFGDFWFGTLFPVCRSFGSGIGFGTDVSARTAECKVPL